jgi:hypothetical protein
MCADSFKRCFCLQGFRAAIGSQGHNPQLRAGRIPLRDKNIYKLNTSNYYYLYFRTVHAVIFILFKNQLMHSFLTHIYIHI